MKLSERVERLEGPDREIDRAIKQAFGHDWDYSADWDYWDALKGETASKPVAKPYTASLDAAMTLVPEGWGVMLHVSENGLHSNVCLARSHPTNLATYGDAATPALALCAAALKARGL